MLDTAKASATSLTRSRTVTAGASFDPAPGTLDSSLTTISTSPPIATVATGCRRGTQVGVRAGWTGSARSQPEADQGIAPEHGHPGAGGEEGPEGDARTPARPTEPHQGQADHRSQHESGEEPHPHVGHPQKAQVEAKHPRPE